MKKGPIIALCLVLVLLIPVLIMTLAPDLLTNLIMKNMMEEQETENTSPYYTVSELTIELTPNFRLSNVESSSNYQVYYGEGYGVEIERMAHSSITPNEGFDFPTLAEFMTYYLSTHAVDSDVATFNTQDDLLYMDADCDHDGTIDTLIVLFESENAFFDVRFTATKDEIDYETVRAQGMEWAKTVTISKE